MAGISDLGPSLLGGGGLVRTISRFVGGGEDATRRTFEAALPATTYAIAEHGSSEAGARALIDGLASGRAPQLDVKDLGRTLADPQASARLAASSGAFLEGLMGGKLDRLLDGLSSFGGLGRAGSSKVLALVTPLALGLIGRRVRDDRLDARGLAHFLDGQRASLAGRVPGPLRALSGLRAAARLPVGRTTEAPIIVPPEGPRPAPIPREDPARRAPIETRPYLDAEPARWRWPWLLAGLAAMLGLGWALGRGVTRQAPEVAAPTARPAVPVPTPSLPRDEPEAAPPAAARAESEGVQQLGSFLAQPGAGRRRFVLDGLSFAEDGATLAPDGEQIGDQLAALLAAHPGARIRVEGFGDATGDHANDPALARARAVALEQHLIRRGVSADRIQAEGVAEGRAQDRRIEVLVSRR